MVRHYGDFEIGHTAFDREIDRNELFVENYELAAVLEGYEASELSWDDFKRHDYRVEFKIWKRKSDKNIDINQ